MSFVRAPNPIWFMVDLVGQPLNDEYYAFFLTNTLPYVPQPVYRDNQGATIWTGSIVEFQPSGTLPNNLYFDPDLVYRIEIRHGPTQSDPLIWEINDFVPEGGISPINEAVVSTDNQASNSQFSQVNFTTPLSITVAGTYEVAPGWSLELSGAGTATISQEILTADADAINKPPYALRFDLVGWTAANLFQRFEGNGGIWASTTTPAQSSAVAVSVTALAEITDETLTISYIPSAGTPQVIATGSVGIAIYSVIEGAIILPPSDNTDFNSLAYVDLNIALPGTGTINISNVQIVGQNEPLVIRYQQETIERQVDHLFHYYSNSLLVQPKGSLLVGWNFALNPWQLRNPTPATAVNNGYVTDQTILIQQNYVATATNNNMFIGQATFMDTNFAIEIIAEGANNQFGLIQYIDPSIIRPYWGGVVSSLVTAFISSSHGTEVKVKLRLFYKAGLPGTISRTDPVASWVSGSDPVFAAGYTAIIPPNDPVYTISAASGIVECPFEKIPLPHSTNVNMTLGIMVYTITDMNQTPGADGIFFNDISLIPNDVASRTQVQTSDDVLRECRLYYEKSYNNNFYAGNITTAGMRFAEQLAINSSPIDFIARSFSFEFNGVKRAPPAITIYSAVGTPANVSCSISNGGAISPLSDLPITSWTEEWNGQKSVAYIASTVAVLTVLSQVSNLPEAYIGFHFIADSRLGV